MLYGEKRETMETIYTIKANFAKFIFLTVQV